MDRLLDALFRNRSHVRVLRALIELPEGLGASARELGRRSRVSHPTASRVLTALSEIGIVHVERGSVADSFRLNAEHVLLDPIRSLFEFERGLRNDLLVFLREQIQVIPVDEAYLFGSVARGEATGRSDIDIAVTCRPDDEQDVVEMLDDLSDVTMRRYGNTIQPIVGGIGRRGGVWSRIRREGIDLLERDSA